VTPKKLSNADEQRVSELEKSIDALWRQGKFYEAMVPAAKKRGRGSFLELTPVPFSFPHRRYHPMDAESDR
jgi:hypothetical protein